MAAGDLVPISWLRAMLKTFLYIFTFCLFISIFFGGGVRAGRHQRSLKFICGISGDFPYILKYTLIDYFQSSFRLHTKAEEKIQRIPCIP